MMDTRYEDDARNGTSIKKGRKQQRLAHLRHQQVFGHDVPMEDPVNPTDDELIAWAREPRAPMPMQDWELLVPTLDRADLFLRLATDATISPARRLFFLHCLYYIVGHVVAHLRPGPWRSPSVVDRETLQNVLDAGAATGDARILQWVEQAHTLLAHPEQFNHDDWFHGGLLYGDWPEQAQQAGRERKRQRQQRRLHDKG